MKRNSIAVEGVGRRFRRYRGERHWTIQELFLNWWSGSKGKEWLWALRDVQFSVRQGEMIGLIGRNGAGKSTLLRLLGGVGRPDEGTVTVNGRVSGMLNLGTGFHPDLTGRHNIFVSGVVAGLTRREIADRFDEIVEFSELHGFIESPVRTYSSGMQMRLGFAVAVQTEPDILLIDEVLAVGDGAFQQKCLARIKEFQDQGRTIVLVSHDCRLVEELCDRVLWLDAGKVMADGPAGNVVRDYLADLDDQTWSRTSFSQPPLLTSSGVELRAHENRYGTFQIEIVDVRFVNHNGTPVSDIECGAPLSIEMQYIAHEPIYRPIFGVTILDGSGNLRHMSHVNATHIDPGGVTGSGHVCAHIPAVCLSPGTYYLDIWAWQHEWEFGYDYHRRAYPLRVRAPAHGRLSERHCDPNQTSVRWSHDVDEGCSLS